MANIMLSEYVLYSNVFTPLFITIVAQTRAITYQVGNMHLCLSSAESCIIRNYACIMSILYPN